MLRARDARHWRNRAANRRRSARIERYSGPALLESAVAKLPRGDIPGAARIHFNRGVYRLAEGDLDGAGRDFDLVVATFPRDFRGYFGRSQLRTRRGEFAGARSDVETAIGLRPRLGSLHYQRGLILEETGERDDSLAAYREAAALGHFTASMRLKKLAISESRR
mgnify:CR=1 FL=1